MRERMSRNYTVLRLVDQTLELKLKRSGDTLLYVDDWSCHKDPITCREILGDAMHRLRALSSAHTLPQAVPSLDDLDLTRLESLRLAVLTLEGVALTPSGNHLGGLRKLTLARVPIPSFMIQNLFQVLQQSPQLESLSIESIRNNPASSIAGNFPSPAGTLELPALTHLAIRRSEPTLSLTILNAVSTSRLHSMAVIGETGESSVPFLKAITEQGKRSSSPLAYLLRNTSPNWIYLEVECGGHLLLHLKSQRGRENMKLALLDGGHQGEMNEMAALIMNAWTLSAVDPPTRTVVKLHVVEDSEIKLRRADFEFILKLPNVQIIAGPSSRDDRVALLEFLTDSSSHPSLHHLQLVDLMGYAIPSQEEELKAIAEAFVAKRELLRDALGSLPDLTITAGMRLLVHAKLQPPSELDSDDDLFDDLFA
ncbi:hypothetical protein FRC05_005824 [Tulasnella sp. 425]|nr:hypothetical protein FRC05_005824 [Tulasnella sp. 425]